MFEIKFKNNFSPHRVCLSSRREQHLNNISGGGGGRRMAKIFGNFIKTTFAPLAPAFDPIWFWYHLDYLSTILYGCKSWLENCQNSELWWMWCCLLWHWHCYGKTWFGGLVDRKWMFCGWDGEDDWKMLVFWFGLVLVGCLVWFVWFGLVGLVCKKWMFCGWDGEVDRKPRVISTRECSHSRVAPNNALLPIQMSNFPCPMSNATHPNV